MNEFKLNLFDVNSRMNTILDYNYTDSSIPKEMEKDQFQLYVENLHNSTSEEDAISNLKKIFLNIQDGFPDEYFSIFSKYNIIDFLIDIMCNCPNTECQIFAILIIYDASFYRRTSFYGFPYIVDRDLFDKFMCAPLSINESNEIDLKSPFVPLYYSKLLYLSFMYSEELAKAFYNSGFYDIFINMCLSSIDAGYIFCWADLILSFSSSSFQIPDDEKCRLIQVFQILYDNQYYNKYLEVVDEFVDSSNNDVIQYINRSSTFDQLISILLKYKEDQDINIIHYREICIHALYKMILRDEYHLCDISLLPIDVLTDILDYTNISDQSCVIQLFSICIKKNEGFLKFSPIDDFIEHGIYNNLMNHNTDFSFESKYSMLEFFIITLIKANRSQLDTLLGFKIIDPVFNNIDCSNTDLMLLLNELLKKFMYSDDLIKYLLPYYDIFQQIGMDDSYDNNDAISEVCQILETFTSNE